MKLLIRTLMTLMAVLILAVPGAWAQGDPFELSYQVIDRQSNGSMTTLTVEVALKNTDANKLGPITATLFLADWGGDYGGGGL